ncbi:UDP-N-acetylglucosamine 1-carboxyvinyltransferase [Anaerobranca californiensis DSM 14826]|jgi:UDP-N-acetylglucosamine 1-carboxyvinyltransferase|uniref:UDP-N-acetylglucosamine 1-carboxyvinyltransferase n=1 Tax=Anaerobranca californiensis DSM 14826 TaxID=1120989 RepID=A0A1M6KUU7_9FIRM|nr:UDP-N-acetylglucosamine 1-carboxyvinyltransferase [Anaerobranca californiensis]SHJ62652.1 UDP-N-acetylglucosamine 1-carboxyvinyltransferase [Anaerobranca californiensis DSM 14826]
MEKLVIKGGNPLKGEVNIQGAKNSVLPILAASLLCEGQCIIHNVPIITDVDMMLEILRSLGVIWQRQGHTLIVDSSKANKYQIDDKLMRSMRSSIFLLGALLGRFNNALVSRPGGCDIGERTTDLHEKGLKSLGAQFGEKGYMVKAPNGLKGAEVYLDYPSVGATENIMLAACKAKGVTVIKNAAREPEIVDLQMFLNKMGAKVSGAGTAEIRIIGVDKLNGCEHRIIPDRIVAGTVLLATAMTKGDVLLKDVIPEHLELIIIKLREMGADIAIGENEIRIKGTYPLKPVDIRTAPYPGFPTDMQPIMMVGLAIAEGTSIVTENVFDARFKHVGEFRRMGADIKISNKTAVIKGVKRLIGTYVEATDLRAGAALVIGGLAGENTTIIEKVEHIDRGYEKIEELFGRLGGNIIRIKE